MTYAVSHPPVPFANIRPQIQRADTGINYKSCLHVRLSRIFRTTLTSSQTRETRPGSSFPVNSTTPAASKEQTTSSRSTGHDLYLRCLLVKYLRVAFSWAPGWVVGGDCDPVNAVPRKPNILPCGAPAQCKQRSNPSPSGKCTVVVNRTGSGSGNWKSSATILIL